MLVTLLELALYFGMLSLISVGGLPSVMSEMQRIVIDVEHWVAPEEFLQLYAVGQASRFAIVESPGLPRGRTQVERRQRVQLTGMWNRRDRAEDALRLVHAGAVVGLDTLQVQLDETNRCDLPPDDRLLQIGNCRVLQVKPGPR